MGNELTKRALMVQSTVSASMRGVAHYGRSETARTAPPRSPTDGTHAAPRGTPGYAQARPSDGFTVNQPMVTLDTPDTDASLVNMSKCAAPLWILGHALC